MEPGLGRVASNYAKSGTLLAAYLYAEHLTSIEKPGPGIDPKLNGYSDYLFFQYLARSKGSDTIKQIFDALAGGKNSVEAIAAAVDMTSVWPEFAKTLWIGWEDKVLDYWANEDEYRFGLAQVYAQVPTVLTIDSSLKDRQKTTKVDQKGQKSAKFELLAAALAFSIRDLGPQAGTFISNDGRILGGDTIGSSPWLLKEGRRVPLSLDSASCVNRNGYVAGRIYGGSWQGPNGEFNAYYHAALWFDGMHTDLGTLGGLRSSAHSVNRWQAVVGLADDAANVPHPFIWLNGVMSSLQMSFAATALWDTDSRFHITESGRIFGTTARSGDRVHAIHLLPVVGGSYELIDLGALDGFAPSVSAFNDLGWAAGQAGSWKR
jgi:hypothetical protein